MDDTDPINWRERLSQVVVPQEDNVYSGVFSTGYDWYSVKKNGEEFDPVPSQKIYNHSPDGFSWGYGGSGPSQLALALLFDVTGDRELSQHFYMDYKWDVIARLSKEEGQTWTLTSADVYRWLQKKVNS